MTNKTNCKHVKRKEVQEGKYLVTRCEKCDKVMKSVNTSHDVATKDK